LRAISHVRNMLTDMALGRQGGFKDRKACWEHERVWQQYCCTRYCCTGPSCLVDSRLVDVLVMQCRTVYRKTPCTLLVRHSTQRRQTE
jgi:hypothetical protein